MATSTTEGSTSAARDGVSGLLLVDKPAGITSHDVVSVVRRAARTRRVGHAGTLDPFATGLLIVLIGRGTRLIPYADGEPKVYEATIRFGAETETDDVTGDVTREAGLPADEAIRDAIPQLTGGIDQIPPSYSAKQVAGRRAYAAARAGKPLDLLPVRVVVHSWEVLGREGADLRVRITCGGGTYIRALARDLGRLTGSAAHLTALRRLRSGPFDVIDAVTVDALREGKFRLAPLRDAIPSMPTRILTPDELRRVGHGNAIDVILSDAKGSSAPERIALLDEQGELVAVAEREGSQLRPKLVLRDV
jgi:tRNA pseudouridine55 synthase